MKVLCPGRVPAEPVPCTRCRQTGLALAAQTGLCRACVRQPRVRTGRAVTGRPSAPPVDYSAQYQPNPGTPLRTLRPPPAAAPPTSMTNPADAPDVAVFAHSPRPRQPANPPEETTP